MIAALETQEFEVVYMDQLCYRDAFEVSPHCRSLAQLTNVEVYRTGRYKATIRMHLHFTDNYIYTISGQPTKEAIAMLSERAKQNQDKAAQLYQASIPMNVE